MDNPFAQFAWIATFIIAGCFILSFFTTKAARLTGVWL